MGFFKRDEERAESPARIEQGGIVRGAEERLRALAADGSLFTSELTVNEFALLRRLGPRPLAQVMGASVVRPGWQYLPALPPGVAYAASGSAFGLQAPIGGWLNPITEPSPAQVRSYKWHMEVVCELDELSRAWTLARRRALDRLTEEALQVGADAVVGVHLQRSDHDLGRGTIEYVVSGTAIRQPGGRQSDRPVITDLSVQDLWRLHGAGHEPVGFLAATAVTFASAPAATRVHRARTTAQNKELEELSQAFSLARGSVRETLRGQLADAHGTDAVGVTMDHAVHREKLSLASSLQTHERRGWHTGRFGLPYFVSGRGETERRGWMITMHAAGTAVSRRPGAPPQPPPTKTAVRL